MYLCVCNHLKYDYIFKERQCYREVVGKAPATLVNTSCAVGQQWLPPSDW